MLICQIKQNFGQKWVSQNLHPFKCTSGIKRGQDHFIYFTQIRSTSTSLKKKRGIFAHELSKGITFKKPWVLP